MANSAPLHSPAPRKLPVVAIVGRPNVGKSTLFNRLVGQRKAIVDGLAGVTRDRNYGVAEWAGRQFVLIDTGGIDTAAKGALEKQVQEQSRLALSEADVVVFLFDGKTGLNPADRDAVDWLRRGNKPVLFAANKIDSKQRTENLYDFYAFGLEHVYSVSAEHGLGIGDLFERVIELFPESPDGAERPGAQEDKPLRIAIVGRPNVGKSTLINRLLGFERCVVDAKPGTTRDALDSPFGLGGEPCLLVDTPGIRRKARIRDRVERFSVTHSLRCVDRGDLIIHLLDALEGVTDQDAQILSYAAQRGKALLIAVNKWDLATKAGIDARQYRNEVYYKLPFLDFAPVSFISAATAYGVEKMLDTAARVVKGYRRRISTSVVNQTLHEIVGAHAPPTMQGKPVKFFYGTQTATRPPTFTFFVNAPQGVPESYRRYLIHQLRHNLGFEHAPITLLLRGRREERKGKKAAKRK